MKFIHAADIHLDSPLSGLTAYPNAPVDLLRTATRRAFSRLVDEAIEEAVSFVIIAGDLYDGAWKDFNTGIFFCGEMGRLHRAGIPLYLLHGNHDAESEMTKKLLLPDNVQVFGSRQATTFHLEDLGVALHGHSFRTASITENLAAGYPDPIAGVLNIGVLHTALEGNAAHANYAPCSMSDLAARDYDYWALGHVHEYAILRENPWVVFPGNLQGRHVRECGPRGAVMVTADEGGVRRVERLLVDVLRWEVVEVDASMARTMDEVVRAVGEALEDVLDNHEGYPIALRIRLTGQTPAHGELFGRETQLRAEVLAQAAAVGEDRLWIEKIRVETTSPFAGERLRARADAVADLAVLLDSAPNDSELLEAMAKELRILVDRAPPELRQLMPELDSIRSGELENLIREVTPGLVAHIMTNS
ncbi:MAG: DNA repair exonuclease [Lamprobacter sp.]|uniref:metallophosphoesterase family protein n=1 Tax=Lamprobacter sp. TaxID=3100796 RepID=UPI002B25BFE7|nr:DNA repair exonuclease [Lamprobacter sp.]MEA3639054.1 DNA repair exonuclease [Lamprobacter sp.]